MNKTFLQLPLPFINSLKQFYHNFNINPLLSQHGFSIRVLAAKLLFYNNMTFVVWFCKILCRIVKRLDEMKMIGLPGRKRMNPKILVREDEKSIAVAIILVLPIHSYPVNQYMKWCGRHFAGLAKAVYKDILVNDFDKSRCPCLISFRLL